VQPGVPHVGRDAGKFGHHTHHVREPVICEVVFLAKRTIDAQWMRPVREQGCFVSWEFEVETRSGFGTDKGRLHVSLL
jgi:hypothetical protein